MTLPPHLTMLTGLLPQEHGVRNNLGFVFEGEATSVAKGSGARVPKGDAALTCRLRRHKPARRGIHPQTPLFGRG
jgi:hypothetical protein